MSDVLLRNAYSQHQAGNLEEAARLYGEILKSDPHHLETLCMLGLIHSQRGELAEAGRAADEALKTNARSPVGAYNLGCLLQTLERHTDAVGSYDRALALRPTYFEALIHRGISLLQLNELEQALAAFDKALNLRPYEVGAWINRGNALCALGRLDQALEAYDRGLAIRPDFAPLHIRRGIVLYQRKNHEEALKSFNKALAPDPRNADALFRRGDALVGLQRYEEALASFDACLAIKVDHVDALVSRGVALRALTRLKDACESYNIALHHKPDCIEALVNRGTALFELGAYEEAVLDHERALELDPDVPHVWGSLIRYRLQCCDWRALERGRADIAAAMRAGKAILEPSITVALSESPLEQLQCARRWSAGDSRPAALWRGERYRHARIRVAYLSADFRVHSTAFLIAGVFEHHDKARFETLAISYGPDEASEMHARLADAFDEFIDVRGKTDFEVASLLRQREVDIAVDLKGYTHDCRPGILACRPAPVQAHYLGYPCTMGKDCIDYLIADRIVIPADHQPYYSENIVYLPDSYQANDSKRRASEGEATRFDAGLPASAFVFASFNSVYKITPEVFSVWMRLLRHVDDSVLWVLADNVTAERNLRREAATRGIAPERLIFGPRVSYPDHLKRQRLADLFLDTLPCNAHTTASDALWAGLPLITVTGGTFAGRVAASLLHALGLPELATDSLDAYEALALELAQDRPALATIRTKLARNRETHPLFDTWRFTRHLEAAYVNMWERYQRGEAPIGFAVDPGAKATSFRP